MIRKVLLIWYTIGSNFGDTFIYNTLCHALSERNIQADYREVSSPCEAILKKANENDYLIFAGGGIIERYIPNVIRYFKEDFSLLKVPYGVVGLGVGSFDYSQYKEELKFWIENAKFFYTRDEYTTQRLYDTCGELSNISTGVDVVWGNKKIIINNNVHRKNRGVNLRNVPYLDIWADMDWSSLRNILIKHGFNKDISDQSEIKLIAGDESAGYTPSKTLAEIGQCELIIAMRYHVVLVAAANGIPVIPIMYCPKVENLAKQIGIRECSVYVNEINRLDKVIDEVIDRRKDIEILLRKSYDTLNSRARQVIENVVDKICSEIVRDK